MGHKSKENARPVDSDETRASTKKRKRDVVEEGVEKERKERRKDKSRKKRDSAQKAAPFRLGATAVTAARAGDYAAENNISVLPESTSLLPVSEFIQLDVHDELKSSLQGFARPTPIQAYAWPALLAGHDVIGVAETGSGKTLAFGLPALNHAVSSSSGVSVLIVAPTRELAIQTHDTLVTVGTPFGVHSVCVYGGVSKKDQVRLLQSPTTRFLVGTPGRLLDLVREGACDLSQVSYLVLDEADRMLDKGFENDIRTIIGFTPSETRQTLMFSATWPTSVQQLADTFLRNPIRVVVGTDELVANKRVSQEVEVFDDPWMKQKHLTKLLSSVAREGIKKIIVFVLYKKEASRVEESIRNLGYTVAGLHGDLSQEQRLAALDSFKEGRVTVLVATDVAARGLDIPSVGLVLNYTFPLTIEDYIHRIGRTGRGGNSGRAVTFFTGENHERALAGELARVMRESGFDASPLKKFPMTVKKKQHSAYGSFFREDVAAPAAQKIRF